MEQIVRFLADLAYCESKLLQESVLSWCLFKSTSSAQIQHCTVLQAHTTQDWMKQTKATKRFRNIKPVAETYMLFNLENHFELQLLQFTLSFPSKPILLSGEHFIHGLNVSLCLSRAERKYKQVTNCLPACNPVAGQLGAAPA